MSANRARQPRVPSVYVITHSIPTDTASRRDAARSNARAFLPAERALVQTPPPGRTRVTSTRAPRRDAARRCVTALSRASHPFRRATPTRKSAAEPRSPRLGALRSWNIKCSVRRCSRRRFDGVSPRLGRTARVGARGVHGAHSCARSRGLVDGADIFLGGGIRRAGRGTDAIAGRARAGSWTREGGSDDVEMVVVL